MQRAGQCAVAGGHGREQIRLGNLDEAQKTLDEVRALNVRWGLFELDTPAKVAETLEKARAAAPPPPGIKGDRTQAKARLKQARDPEAAAGERPTLAATSATRG